MPLKNKKQKKKKKHERKGGGKITDWLYYENEKQKYKMIGSLFDDVIKQRFNYCNSVPLLSAKNGK